METPKNDAQDDVSLLWRGPFSTPSVFKWHKKHWAGVRSLIELGLSLSLFGPQISPKRWTIFFWPSCFDEIPIRILFWLFFCGECQATTMRNTDLWLYLGIMNSSNYFPRTSHVSDREFSEVASTVGKSHGMSASKGLSFWSFWR